MTTPRRRSILLCSLACGLPFAIANLVVVPLGDHVGGPEDPRAVWVFVCMGAIEGAAVPTGIDVGFVSMAASYFACLAAVMLVVRRLGYRLAWGRRRAGPACAADRSGQPPG